jgi:hypothetical protein
MSNEELAIGNESEADAEGYTLRSSQSGGRGITLYARGEAVAMSYQTSTGGRSVYLGKDILGSVRSATSDGGVLEERYEYDAFGTPYQGDLSGGMNLGYTGKPYDTATGLYNYGFRDYQLSEEEKRMAKMTEAEANALDEEITNMDITLKPGKGGIFTRQRDLLDALDRASADLPWTPRR